MLKNVRISIVVLTKSRIQFQLVFLAFFLRYFFVYLISFLVQKACLLENIYANFSIIKQALEQDLCFLFFNDLVSSSYVCLAMD
jgi:hypothetical protein